MITVTIYSDGALIHTVSADNIGEVENGYHQYALDFGETVVHDRDSGVVELAIQMLAALADWED